MTDSILVLVVDDSPIQRRIYSAALKASGYEVIVAENGQQGVDMALHHYPALILMDISMPVMDGLAAVRELRRYPEMEQVPILAITAFSDPAELEEAYEAGYDDAVDKSSDRAILLDTVHRWLFG